MAKNRPFSYIDQIHYLLYNINKYIPQLSMAHTPDSHQHSEVHGYRNLQVPEMVTEIRKALAPREIEQFDAMNLRHIEEQGSESVEYTQWLMNQFVRYVLGVKESGGIRRFELSGSTRKPGSHASNRHR